MPDKPDTGGVSPPSPLRGGVGGGGFVNSRLARPTKNIARARSLRTNATPPERHLWKVLRSFNANGHHFRRQVPIGPYFADFAGHHPKLVVELDGDTHGTSAGLAYDARRDAYLRRIGYVVLRVTNPDVIKNPEGVWHLVHEALASITPTPDPSPQGGGGPGLHAVRHQESDDGSGGV